MVEAPIHQDRWTTLRRRLSAETTGGVLLLIAAAVALIWANSPWREGYSRLVALEVGPSQLGLHLSLGQWAADGLLAIFFFVVGVELKHEVVAGSLRQPRLAGVPIAAAVGGMAVPAAIFVAVIALRSNGDPDLLRGWAIPTATDIAFAVAVLAVFGRGLPMALRTFLLTLAVVDDLLGIVVIATFYTETIDVGALAGALAVIVTFGVVVRLDLRGIRFMRPPVLIALGVVAWALMHESGVHATVAGVLLGFTVPAVARFGDIAPTTTIEHAVRPFSTVVAVPVFALFAAGVSIIGAEGGLATMLSSPVTVAIIAGLAVGKVVGVLGTTALVTWLTPLRLPDAVGLRDLVPVGVLTGMGFTVSLLIAELSFPDGPDHDAAKVAILIATVIAAVVGAGTLRWDAHRARSDDMNQDGVVDVDTAVIGGN
ncbi:Na(+)/H(+) antiporter NhaA [Gordonia effusa NBRC 100432]|uniref:Na(+)/H(+) antiporter NhaA n=1 Tax=Gordonia effusa NBRC 100432 TaxID=1077974 RepID=H0QWB4_9ACTN|nr:Na+/H+ antiporter NhaA [Gordonia effusa]GAB17115.1 Na(+)/H(+) antiporter NhaA [Gordonia effusa NBRC 100432]